MLAKLVARDVFRRTRVYLQERVRMLVTYSAKVCEKSEQENGRTIELPTDTLLQVKIDPC